MPRRARLNIGMRVTSTPSNTTSPSSGAIIPIVIRNEVVLPAPFRPNRPTISPWLTMYETLSTTALPP